MLNRDQDIQNVRHLSHNEICYVRWSEGGGGEVHRIWDWLFLFEIPLYGGAGRYVREFRLDEAESLVDLAYQWT
jgi:hypothetical protein